MKLTLWYVSLLTALLLLYVAGTSFLFFRNLQMQLSHHAVEDLETIEGLLFFAPDGTLQLREDYHRHSESKELQERLVEVRSPSGSVLYRNERLRNREIGPAPFPGEGQNSYSSRRGRLADGTSVQVVSRRHLVEGHPTLIRVAYSEEPIERDFKTLIIAEFLGLLITMLVAGAAGYALARRTLAPLEQMALRAEQITSDRLYERLPGEHTSDELGHIARVFNRALSRLELSFGELQRFSSTAPKELCDPLTVLRSIGEAGVHRDRDRAEYREIIRSMVDESSRLANLIGRLLETSRAAAKEMSITSQRERRPYI